MARKLLVLAAAVALAAPAAALPGEATLPDEATLPAEAALPGEATLPGEAALPGEATLPAEAGLPDLPPAVVALGDRAAEIRAVAEAGAPGDPLRALLLAAGQPVAGAQPAAAQPAAAQPPPRPGPDELARTAGLPADLRAPVAGLLAAVRAADALLAGPTEADVREGMAVVEEHARRLTHLGHPDPMQPEPFQPPDPGILPGSVRRAAEHTPEAVALLAAAFDRWLPELRSAATATGVQGDGDGCDVVDELPLLCVGSEADNTYTEPAALLVDLGGDDTHLHPAGAAPFVADGATFMVSVTLDLAGDDRYVAQPVPGTSTSPSGQGYGALGGVGILYDVEGNDRYEASAPPTTPDDLDAAVAAQGIGLGAGYGLLVDLAGDDRYRAETHDGTEDTAWVYGQGLGYLFGGAGGVVDLGAGDDTYELDAGTVHGVVRPWTVLDRRHNRQVQGQASSYTGTGLVVDDGGTDTFTAVAHARASGGEMLLDPDLPRPQPPLDWLVPLAAIWGQGAGIFGGSSYLLAGAGDTTYEAEATGDPMAQGSLLVQGFGFLGGAAVLDDLGGDDVYRARVLTGGLVETAVTDGCDCGPARAGLEPFVSGVSAQGWGGAAGGVGLLADHGGDDRYTIENVQSVEFAVTDHRGDPPGPAAADLVAWPPPAMGQGWATVAGAGVLLDAGGTDEYRLTSRLDASVEARADGSAGESAATATVLPRLFALGGQGAARAADASYGALLDLGGEGDAFAASASTHVVTAPTADGVRTVGLLWPPFQGSGDSGVFAALGEAPAVRSSPSQGVCAASTGPRGFGTWSECALQGAEADRQYYDAPAQNVTATPSAQHVAVGVAPWATGEAPALVFTGDTPAIVPAGGAVEVGARLAAPDGSPIEGATVRFNLQFAVPSGVDGIVPSWFNGWEVVAVTAADGVARARVPTDLGGLAAFLNPGFPGPATWSVRLHASFDGAPGLHPRHVAVPVTAG